MTRWLKWIAAIAVASVVVFVWVSRSSDEQADQRVRGATDSVAFLGLLPSSEPFGAIVSLKVSGQRIFASDMLASPHHLFAVDAQTGQVVAEFGRNGEGPGEVRSPFITGVDVITPDTIRLAIWDARRGVLIKAYYNMNTDSVVGMDETRPSIEGRQVARMVAVGNHTWANPLVGAQMVVQVGREGEMLRTIGVNAPHPVDAVGDAAVRNRSMLAVSPDGQTAILAYRYAAQIDLVDLRSGDVTSTVTADTSKALPADTPNRERAGYVDVAADQKGIYALYLGPGESIARTVHQFSPSGQFLAAWELGQAVASIAVDEESDLLYGGIVEPEPGIGRWSIVRGR